MPNTASYKERDLHRETGIPDVHIMLAARMEPR